ncbi:MAG: lactate utilization protein B [Gammaproteobacteria bacterium]
MRETAITFRRRISVALADDNLRRSLATVRDKFTSHRAAAVRQYEAAGGDFERLRERGRQIRDETVRRMPALLREFERNAEAAGAKVLWAKNAASARRLIAGIARRHGVRIAVKSKSMASEEIQLNDALQNAGVEAVETDLGEFIVQLGGETPSHIIAPAMHKRREEAAAIVRKVAQPDGDDIPAITRAARAYLREKFLRAEMGISGANFLVADTGSALIVTNEGNGRMTTTLPRVHITLAGVDKIIARREDIPDMLALLTRSATGQRLSNYVSISTGVREGGDGPAHSYVVLLDNGRSRLRQSDCAEMLRCIRCGACMNHCPVYHAIGGHAYGATYMGPMGQVLTPALHEAQRDSDLPHAATMCGACAVVCPVKIPLPDLMRRLRKRQMREKIRPLKERALLRLWFFVARRPALYAAAAATMCAILARVGGAQKRIRKLPLAGGWFAGRDLTAPPGRTFRAVRARFGL